MDGLSGILDIVGLEAFYGMEKRPENVLSGRTEKG